MIASFDHQPEGAAQVGARFQSLPVAACDGFHPVDPVLGHVALRSTDGIGAHQDRVCGVSSVQKHDLPPQQPPVKVFVLQEALVRSKVVDPLSASKGWRDDSLDNIWRLPLTHGFSFSIVGLHSPMMERGARFDNRAPQPSITSKDAA